MKKRQHPQAHVMVLGDTLCGKTTLAKALNDGYIRVGQTDCLVLEAIQDKGFKTKFSTQNSVEFFRWLKIYPQKNAFMDDADGKYSRVMTDAARIGRHFGNRLHFITHRGAMLNPTIRGACTELFLFRTPVEDSKKLASDWICPALKLSPRLVPGQYIHFRKGGRAEIGNVFS